MGFLLDLAARLEIKIPHMHTDTHIFPFFDVGPLFCLVALYDCGTAV